MVKKRFKVDTLHCSGCVLILESIEDELDGVLHVSASYRKQQLDVEYDEAKVKEEDIIAAVRQKGYNAYIN